MPAGGLCCGGCSPRGRGEPGTVVGSEQGRGECGGALARSPEAGALLPLTASLLRCIWVSTSPRPHREGLGRAATGPAGRLMAEQRRTLQSYFFSEREI